MFSKITISLIALRQDDRGVTLVEYGVALALALAIGTIALTTLGGEISAALGIASSEMPD